MGSCVAISSLELHRRRAEAGAVYRASLAAGLSALGFAIERQTGNGGHYFEVRGSPDGIAGVVEQPASGDRRSPREQWRQEFLEHFGREPSHLRGARVGGQEQGGRRAGICRGGSVHLLARHGGLPLASPRRRGDAPTSSASRCRAQGRARLVAELLGSEGVTREHATFDMPALRVAAYERAPGLVSPAEVERALADLLRDDRGGGGGPRRLDDAGDPPARARVLAWRDADPGRVDEAVAAFRSSTRRRQGPEKAPPAPRMVEEALLRCPVRLSDEQRRPSIGSSAARSPP